MTKTGCVYNYLQDLKNVKYFPNILKSLTM